MEGSDNNNAHCWICKDEYNVITNFCNCKNEFKIVHKNCLEEWINFSHDTKCKICNGKYNIKKNKKSCLRWKCSFIYCNVPAICVSLICLLLLTLTILLVKFNLKSMLENIENSDLIALIYVIAYSLPCVVGFITVIHILIALYDYYLAAKSDNITYQVYEYI
ncbi:putative E3 ubiquitin ligase [Goatpox virus]|uniref:E3 ubiquitin-protein ligase LAP n=1 Tax=Goatpox virus TaxID=186805 RepID=A0A2Z4XG22_9POXV|nr:hypothetical protein [Goatpox virus]QEJ78710.1 putative E3 ubiquitin ligase [Goatpox virus]QEJ78860.1 putative E3 ubiquitin ligase [Goatpox virus]QOK36448.1 putative E3 ubiquitin ligase [Goatpox virus]